MNVENRDTQKSEIETSLRWLKIAAGTTFLIGIAGLLAIMSHGAWAADTKPGFATGNKAFANPFGNANNAADEDDDDLDFNDQTAKTAPGHAPGAPATAPGMPSSATQAQGAPSASMGGGPSNGVISTNDLSALQINDETGDGSKETVTDFNFPDADIMDIARTLGKLTGKNFIFDKDVKGRISLISNSQITVGDAWRAFLTSLDMAGFALIPSGKYLRIARNRDARDKQLKTYTGDFSPNTDALITRIFVLKYINADEVARTFRSFMPANSRIMSYDQTNTVIVTDTGANIAKLQKMLEILDIEGYDAGIEVIQVKYASAAELAKLIDQLLPGTGAATGAPGQPRFGGGGGFGASKFNARRTKEGGIINTIIADDRTNTMIVHANTKGADQVRDLVSKLDQKVPLATGGGKVHVVYLQFAEAEAIATTLNNLSSAAAGGFKPTGAAGGTGTNPNSASLFEGSIKVSADKATNSLVVTASPMDFITVQRVINRLDIPRDEVYVEVIIMEIALNRENDYSANIASIPSGILSSTNSDLQTFITAPQTLTGGVLGFAGGHTTQISAGGQNFTIASIQGLVRFIQSNTKSNVLATPQIIALDNTEAFFEQSENIPYLTSTAVPNAGVSQTVSKERVALSIKIKPQINKISNFVKMDVEARLGDIENRPLPQAVQGQAYATQDRTAKTTVVVADTDTVVLGGLIRDNVSEQTTKIPILGDIPILGWLFKSHTSTVQKTNLLVFLTPHIVRQYERVRAILDKKLRERDQFIETNSGGDDLVRNQRDAMIRSLPDINSVTQNPPQGSVTIGDEDSGDGAPKSGNPFTGSAEAPTSKGAAPANPPSGANPDGSVPNPGAVAPPQGSNNGAIPSAPIVAPPPPTANPAAGG
jgi:general secretion pathway protein D